MRKLSEFVEVDYREIALLFSSLQLITATVSGLRTFDVLKFWVRFAYKHHIPSFTGKGHPPVAESVSTSLMMDGIKEWLGSQA